MDGNEPKSKKRKKAPTQENGEKKKRKKAPSQEELKKRYENKEPKLWRCPRCRIILVANNKNKQQKHQETRRCKNQQQEATEA
jgi:hypothetical protein